MSKLTKNQIGLIQLYAQNCAYFKKYWLTFMLGGISKVASNREASKQMIYWAYQAYECGKDLGLNDKEIMPEVVNWSKCYDKAAA